MPKVIKFIQLKLQNFTNHKSLTVDYGDITKLSGSNGAGKTSVGTAPAWILYGVDLLGKTFNPSPTNYEFDKVFASILLSVDGNQVLLARGIENGEATYYINEVPKKATAFNDYVKTVFDKDLFLSLYSPSYFFSQHWKIQRGQVMKNVAAPANLEVFAEMSRTSPDQKAKDIPLNPQAAKLAEVFKKNTITDLQTKHAKIKKDMTTAYPKAQGSVITLDKQLKALGEKVVIDREAIQADIDANQIKITEYDADQKKINERAREIADKQAWIERLTENINNARSNKEIAEGLLEQLKSKEIDGDCESCKQPLTEDGVKSAEEAKQADITNTAETIETIRTNGNIHFEERKRLKEELKLLEPLPPLTYTVTDLVTKSNELRDKLQVDKSITDLEKQLETAKAHEAECLRSKNDSIFILDAINAFTAKEAQMQVHKVEALFTNLSVRLLDYVKSDDRYDPFFMIQLDGKDYTVLSGGERVKARLELAEVLYKQSELIVPCFLDELGEYTGDIAVYDQLITGQAVKGEPLKINGKEVAA